MWGLKTDCTQNVLSDFINRPLPSCMTAAVLQLWSWFSAQQQNHCGVMIKRRCLGHWHQQWSTGTLLDTPWLLGSFGPSISPVLIQRRIPALQSFVLEMKGEDALLWHVSDSKCGSAGLECSWRCRRHGYRQIIIIIFFLRSAATRTNSHTSLLPANMASCVCWSAPPWRRYRSSNLWDGGIELVLSVS